MLIFHNNYKIHNDWLCLTALSGAQTNHLSTQKAAVATMILHSFCEYYSLLCDRIGGEGGNVYSILSYAYSAEAAFSDVVSASAWVAVVSAASVSVPSVSVASVSVPSVSVPLVSVPSVVSAATVSVDGVIMLL